MHLVGFNLIDANNDDRIDAEELHAYLLRHPELRACLPLAEVTDLMENADAAEEGWRAIADALQMRAKEFEKIMAQLPEEVQ